jgi:hypothetical protein
MSREKAMKAANLIADDFEVGFCDSKMVELFADRIEEVYANENAMSKELLKRVRDTLHELEETHYDLYWDIQAELDKAERELIARYKPVSDAELIARYETIKLSLFYAGFRNAEKAHGITGVDDETHDA